MALSPGTRLGAYEITARIGEGGMGQVFRATDTRLKRQVAIKVLPTPLAGDAERLARFQREAEVLASLSHPNIAALYGLEERAPSAGSGLPGLTALVMELVEGDDLSQRLARGALPIEDALPVARQIAEALEAAHELGVIHRDLKPSNIKVRPDGIVKVLDFGLAKVLETPAAAPADATKSPTVTSPAMTHAGAILGTAAYMSPEQARGTAVDKRADIWAFGVVLFEMLTATRLFAGATVSDTIAAVLKTEPDWTRLPAETPAAIHRLLRRCLEKDRKRRLDSAAAARLEIDDAATAATSAELAAGTATVPTPHTGTARLAAAAVVAAVIAALAVPALRHLREVAPSPAPEMRVEIATPATDAPLQFALSPDGRSLVFVASGDGRPRLWLRPLGQADAQPLPGTDGATAPFWSPDSRSIAFFAADRLHRLDVDGIAPQAIATVEGRSPVGSWGPDGTILFAHSGGAPVRRVAASGGEPVAVTRTDPPRVNGHRVPQFLPDGHHFLFYAQGSPDAAGLYLGSLDERPPTRLTAADSGGGFLPPDGVLFVNQGTLVARHLDLAGRKLTGDPVTVADRVGVESARGGFAISDAGVVAYRRGGGITPRQLVWVDRAGIASGVAGDILQNPELSPDGRRVAMTRLVQNNLDLWLLDLIRGGMIRFSFDVAIEGQPAWSPDGSRIAFASNRTGVYNMYVKPADGSTAEARVVESPTSMFPQDWSPDGKWLVYSQARPSTGRDLLALDMTDAALAPRMILETPADEVQAQISPDGRWLAYQTNESGRFEVVVQSFADPGARWPVSTDGGTGPRWRADGRELYFLAPDATMMAAPVMASSSAFEAGVPQPLFVSQVVGGGSSNGWQYVVGRDGRFLINQPVAAEAAAPITLLLNWQPATK